MPEKIKEVKVGWQKLKTVDEAEAEARELVKKILDKAVPTNDAGK